MMDVRGMVKAILEAGLTVPVYSSKVEPFKGGNVVSVQYDTVNRKPIAHDMTFRTAAKVAITLAVVKTDGYDTELDSLVALCITALLTNAAFVASFEEITGVDTQYGYGESGDTNLATAIIMMGFQFTETFDPVITTALHGLNISVDFIAPATDPNLFTSNPDDYLVKPDGRIEYDLPIDLPQ
jgi:hypothetical protein